MKRREVVCGLAALAVALLTITTNAIRAQEGPQSQSGESVAKPKKKPSDTGAAPDNTPQNGPLPDTGATTPAQNDGKIPSEYKRQKQEPEQTPTFRTEALTVNVDVAVLDDHGRFIPKIPRSDFRILEDGVPQQISEFSTSEAPMTVCMLVEFSGLFQSYWSYGWGETLTASYGFLDTLKADDNVAIVAYDLRPTILSDFSPNKQKAQEAMSRLRIPGFSESNLFDALTDMADRMSGIEGRKAILLIASGIDTFSKLTFDKARRSLQASGVPVYSISILQIARELADARGYMGPIQRLDFLQADNELRTFAKETGGQAFFPRFTGELPGVYRALSDALRNQYSLGYHPTNTARDGKFRRIKVELVNAEGDPLRVVNEKGKPIKYQIIAKAGYTAPREIE